jgi:hypothetical protein
LSPTALRYTECPCVLDLTMNAITQQSRLGVYTREILPAGRTPNTENVLDDEQQRSEILNILQKLLVEVSAFILDETAHSVVGAIALSSRAEALTGWPADDDVDTLVSDLLRELLRPVLRQIFFQCVWDMRQIAPERRHCFRVEIYGSDCA